MGMTGCQALEEWCRIVLNTYSGVHISNMTSSWSDGKAFCALIHSHRPDLIDWEHVKKNSAAQNCQLAFQTAEQRLGISSLLDVCDVVRGTRGSRDPPDRLSILTYVSQFYHRFQSDPDSGISSPSDDTKYTRRGGVHSLLSNRRSRSVSSSPPIEKENPFRREFLDNISCKAERSPCKKLVNKFHKQKNNTENEQQSVRLRHQNREKENKTRRLVKSMFVEPLQDSQPELQHQDKSVSVVDGICRDEKPIKSLRASRSQGLLGTPKPYRNFPTQPQQQSQSILSKTQNYLQEKRKRSQSQPPVSDKKEKRKFDFLSTANFNSTKSKKPVESQDMKPIPRGKIQEKSRVVMSEKTMPIPPFCHFQKFEFALQNHRRFVQTMV